MVNTPWYVLPIVLVPVHNLVFYLFYSSIIRFLISSVSLTKKSALKLFTSGNSASKSYTSTLKSSISAPKSDISASKTGISATKSDISASKSDISATKSEILAPKYCILTSKSGRLALWSGNSSPKSCS